MLDCPIWKTVALATGTDLHQIYSAAFFTASDNARPTALTYSTLVHRTPPKSILSLSKSVPRSGKSYGPYRIRYCH